LSNVDSQSSDSRWWEFYFVRYAMGTVIGAILLYLLKDSFADLDTAIKNFSGTELLLVYAALGLAYCYIASTPLLVIHACRYNRICISRNIGFFVLVFLLLTTVPIILVASYFIETSFAFGLLIIIELVLLLCQIWLLHQLFSDEFNQLRDFYINLDVKRSLLSKELRNSYKHLREHGNSIAIVVLEIDLAAIVYAHGVIAEHFGINSLWIMLATFGLWIAPAAFVYLVGHELEYQLTK